MSEVMGVAAKREEQQARYESLAHTRPDDRDQTGTTRLEAMKLINSKILDYKHEHPANLRKTIELLLKLCQNICDAPEDPRFRKIRARNAAFAASIAQNTSAIKLMSVSGWHTVTDNLEKTWVFDHAPGTPQMRVLPEIVTELRKALDEINRKDKMLLATGDKKRVQQEQHEAAVRQIEEDRRDRQDRQARLREAELASSASAAAEASQQENADEQPEHSAAAEEHLLEDEAATEQAGRLRQRRVAPLPSAG